MLPPPRPPPDNKSYYNYSMSPYCTGEKKLIIPGGGSGGLLPLLPRRRRRRTRTRMAVADWTSPRNPASGGSVGASHPGNSAAKGKSFVGGSGITRLLCLLLCRGWGGKKGEERPCVHFHAPLARLMRRGRKGGKA